MKKQKTTIPFFSVIIPTLNEENYLPKLLKNLLEQTSNDFEVIVVDGKSEDKTTEKAESYIPKFSKKAQEMLIVTAQKRNVSFQRNLGAKNAQGTFLVFLDADSQIPPYFLEQVKQQIIKRDLTFVTTWLDVDSNSPQDKIIALFINLIVETAPVIDKSFVGGYNFMVKRSVFNKTDGFHEKVKIAEDHEMAIKISKMGYKLTILKEPRLTFSLRRFRREGRLHVMRNYTHSAMYSVFKGPVMKELFEYPMGGEHYVNGEKRKKEQILSLNKLKKQIDTYIAEIKKLS